MERNLDDSYIYARLVEALDDSLLAIELFERGFTRNSTRKVFTAVKALLSALVVKYGDKLVQLAKDEKEKEWVKKRAHTVPTRSMKTLEMYFEKVVITVDLIVELALDLRGYQLNGFDCDFSRYRTIEEVKNDMIEVISEIPELINKYFEIKDSMIIALEEKVKSELKKFEDLSK
ncbi:PaREP1 family protein [Sulfurisphaera javensis]|uniref:PaREP1 family protein n=1 Tax=Sulfurisphaera javensis TaxID=2049879 RepID=UPI0034E8C187